MQYVSPMNVSANIEVLSVLSKLQTMNKSLLQNPKYLTKIVNTTRSQELGHPFGINERMR